MSVWGRTLAQTAPGQGVTAKHPEAEHFSALSQQPDESANSCYMFFEKQK